MKINIRVIYLYLFSFVGLLIVVVGAVRLVDLGLKTFVFTEVDRYEIYQTSSETGRPQPEISDTELQQRQDREISRQRQREFSGAISMVAVGLPLYLYHWSTIQKENNKKSKD